MKTFMRMISFIVIGLVATLTGCKDIWKSNTFEQWEISCKKDDVSGKWKKYADNIGLAKNCYRISFENQIVVSDSAYRYTDCRVFSKNEWVCQNHQLPEDPLVVINGKMSPWCDKRDYNCSLPVSNFRAYWIRLIKIFNSDVESTECETGRSAFEFLKKTQ